MIFPILFKVIKIWFKLKCIYPLILIIFLIQPYSEHFVFYLLNSRIIIIILGIVTFLYQIDMKDTKLYRVYIFTALLALLFAREKLVILSMTLPLILYSLNACININNNKVNSIFYFIGNYTIYIYVSQCCTIEYINKIWQVNTIYEYLFKFFCQLFLTFFVSFILFHIQKLFLRTINSLKYLKTDSRQKSIRTLR